MESEVGATYHAERPEDAVVDEQPGLLSEARDVATLRDAAELGRGNQEVFYDPCPQAGEDDNAEGNDEAIVGANGIATGVWVTV